jgi:hypothetical protein
MISPQQKQEIYERAMRTFTEWYGERKMLDSGACLYLNQVAMREIALTGERVILQAGTMLWRIVPNSADDGRLATHFGYQFGLDEPFSQAAMAEGGLPEIHIWCALPDYRELVDFSTGYLPQVAKKQHGYTWWTEAPPAYVWGRPPADAFYEPSREAIRFAWNFIMGKLVDDGIARAMAEKVNATALV